jgi:hypothetical protein
VFIEDLLQIFLLRQPDDRLDDLATVTFPAYSLASASTVGPSRLHGPHHSAQKSTMTGGADFSTLSSKFPSVKVCTFSAAIVSP